MQDGDSFSDPAKRSPADQDNEVEPSLRLMLQAARDAQGLSIEDVAAELRIEARFLRALEAGRFDELGPPVFAKGYLKQYGHRLGLDYRDLLSEYYRLVEPRDVEIKASKVIKLRDERQITVWIVAVLTLALLAVALLIWWVRGSARIEPVAIGSGTGAPTIEPAEARPDEARFDEARPDEVAPGEARFDGARPDEAPLAVAPADQASRDEAPTDEAPAGAGRDGEAGIGRPATRPSAAGADSGAPPAAAAERASLGAPSVGASALTIEIAFVEDCWAEITDGTGERVYYGLGAAGTRSTLRAVPPVRVFLGNADGVELGVEGRAYAVPAGGRRGELASFTIDPPAD